MSEKIKQNLGETKKDFATDGNVFTLKTVQIAPFRTLMTALKELLIWINLILS